MPDDQGGVRTQTTDLEIMKVEFPHGCPVRITLLVSLKQAVVAPHDPLAA